MSQEENSKNVEVTLTVSAEHYRMIERCAKLFGKSVEQWILQDTVGALQSIVEELEYTGINVGFGHMEIDAVIDALESGVPV